MGSTSIFTERIQVPAIGPPWRMQGQSLSGSRGQFLSHSTMNTFHPNSQGSNSFLPTFLFWFLSLTFFSLLLFYHLFPFFSPYFFCRSPPFVLGCQKRGGWHLDPPLFILYVCFQTFLSPKQARYMYMYCCPVFNEEI